ncbi:MAG: M1 family metallopeptidase [Gemmatimonadetes bacterium]|nr:M1 family metallopeptidase [Gemmatimonadota bacterium]NNF11669.1 M1 family metallopeptidase [Gemmatimonadota bacterium]
MIRTRLSNALRALTLVGTGLSLLGAPLAAQEPEPIEAGVAPPFGRYAPGVDVLHYEVEIGLGYGTDWFAGRVDVHVAAEDDGPVLPLDFTGLTLEEVAVDGHPARYDHVAGVLRVPLEAAEEGDRVIVTVVYRGVPDDGLILRPNVHGAPSAFVDNWPNRTRFWLPSVDHPADKATVNYTVHAPAQWKVIANGAQVGAPVSAADGAIGPDGERLTWRWEVGVPISPYNMVIGAADMTVQTVGLAACGQAPASRRDDGCVEVTYWVFPQDVERAEPSFRRAAEMVDYFTDLFGPFPFEKLANVQSATRFGGMENASAIFYSEQAIASGRNIEGTVSHEIVHQWFGDAVTEENWHHLWLSEGFATYFGDQFFEAADGEESFRRLMGESRQGVINSSDVERPIYDPAETSLFALLNANNYPKGGWVLHMLRGIVGDDAFFTGIREYYGRYLHSVADTEDFQAVMEESSGDELDWFFSQWIYRPGFPTFDVQWRWIPGEGSTGTVEVTVRQIQRDSWPTFRVPTEIALEGPGGSSHHEIELLTREEVIRIDGVKARPSRVVLDPDGWVLKGDGGR